MKYSPSIVHIVMFRGYCFVVSDTTCSKRVNPNGAPIHPIGATNGEFMAQIFKILTMSKPQILES